ncbi:MAG: hypothetical protein JNL70_06715 [Saprospiraceae bacterium]|nr:hypothetical protein [Saprospiraceae bacterium]
MKCYYYQGKLIVELSDGLAIICELETVVVSKKRYKRLSATMIYLPTFLKENKKIALVLVPFNKQQALQYFMRLRAHDAIYRTNCEILWKQQKYPTSEDEMIKLAWISMVEYHLDAPKSTKPSYFHWRKKTFAFTLS